MSSSLLNFIRISVVDHPPIIQHIVFLFFQTFEKPSKVDDPAEGKPDRRDHRHDAGDDNAGNEKPISPPGVRPWRQAVPDDQDYRTAKAPARGINENRPG